MGMGLKASASMGAVMALEYLPAFVPRGDCSSGSGTTKWRGRGRVLGCVFGYMIVIWTLECKDDSTKIIPWDHE